jgi:hypothetical protein
VQSTPASCIPSCFFLHVDRRHGAGEKNIMALFLSLTFFGVRILIMRDRVSPTNDSEHSLGNASSAVGDDEMCVHALLLCCMHASTA